LGKDPSFCPDIAPAGVGAIPIYTSIAHKQKRPGSHELAGAHA
jgi:hypothetical protein